MENKPTVPRKKHVLVVDDDLELTEVYRQLLEANNYVTSTASNGVLALKQISYQEVDAVICDLKMPELEGDLFYSTVERVKPELRQRFIFITGVADDPKYQPFLNRVGVPVLQKPVGADTLLTELRRVLGDDS